MAEQITYQDFATRIREKYNAYQDVDDSTLVSRYLQKYPVYEERLSNWGVEEKIETPVFEAQTDPVTAPTESTKTPLIPQSPLPRVADEDMQIAKSTLQQLGDEEKARIEESITRKTEGMNNTIRAGLGIIEMVPGAEIATHALGLDKYQLTPLEWEYAKEQGANWSRPIGFGQRISINDIRELSTTIAQFYTIGGATSKALESTKWGQKLLAGAKIGKGLEKVGARVAKSMIDFNLHSMLTVHPDDFTENQSFVDAIKDRVQQIPQNALDGSIFGMFGSVDKGIKAYGGLFSAGYITSYLQTQDHAESFKNGVMLTGMHAINALGVKGGQKFFEDWAAEKNVPDYLVKEANRRLREDFIKGMKLLEGEGKLDIKYDKSIEKRSIQVGKLKESGFSDAQIGRMNEAERVYAIQNFKTPEQGIDITFRRLTSEDAQERDYLNKAGIINTPKPLEKVDPKFETPGAIRFNAFGNELIDATHAYYRGDQLTPKEVRKFLTRQVIDVSGNLKRELEKTPEGQDVIMRHDLILGSSARTSNEIRNFNKEVFNNMSPGEIETLSKIRLAKRIDEIDRLELGELGRTFKEYRQAKAELETAEGKRKSTVKAKITRLEKKIEAIEKENFGEPDVKTYKILPEEAKAYLTEFKDKYPEEYKKLDAYDGKIIEKYQQKLDQLRENEILSQNDYENLSQQVHYEPRKFIQHLNDFTRERLGGSEISLDYTTITPLNEGSRTPLIVDTQSLLQSALYRYNYAIDKNRANNSLYDFAEKHPENGVVKIRKPTGFNKQTGQPTYAPGSPAGKEAITLRRDGQRRQLLMDKEMAQEWVTQDKALQQTVATAFRHLSGSSVLRAMATGYNPAFILTNMPRDIALAWFSSGQYNSFYPIAMGQMGRDLFVVSKDAIFRKGRYNDFLDQGGGMPFLTHQGRMMSQSKYERLSQKFKTAQQVLGYLGETSEILTRLAIRERALRNGKSPFQATWHARNYLDFSQGGQLVKAADTGVPYLNAGIQGTRSVAREFKRNLPRALWKVSQIMGTGMGFYLANHTFNKEAYDAISDREKVSNWIMPLPLDYVDKNGNRRYLYMKIAKDQGQRIFASAGESLMQKLVADENPSQLMGQAMQDFWPYLPGSQIPPVLASIFAYTQDHDFWLNSEVWRGQDVQPWAEVYANYTPKGWQKFGEITRDVEMVITGEEDPSAARGFSPVRSQRAVQKLFTYNNFYTQMIALPWKTLTWGMSEDERDEVNRPVISHIRENIPGVEKIIGETYPEKSKRAEMLDIQANTKKKMIRDDIQQVMQDDGRDAGLSLVKNLPQEYRDYGYGLYKAMKDKPTLDQWWWDLSSIQDPRARARFFYEERYASATPDERRSLMQQANQLDGIVSNDFKQMLSILKRGEQ